MKQTEVKKSLLGIMERTVRTEVERNNSGRPFCIGFFHQPKRPERVQIADKIKEK